MKKKTLFVNIARNVERSVMRVVSLSLFLETSMRSGWYLIFSSRLQDGFLNEAVNENYDTFVAFSTESRNVRDDIEFSLDFSEIARDLISHSHFDRAPMIAERKWSGTFIPISALKNYFRSF